MTETGEQPGYFMHRCKSCDAEVVVLGVDALVFHRCPQRRGQYRNFDRVGQVPPPPMRRTRR